MSRPDDRLTFDMGRAANGAHTAEERRRARLQVASRATDPDDCRELLDALGLLPPPKSLTP